MKARTKRVTKETVRGRFARAARNPGTAEEMSESFHGRAPRETFDVVEDESYDNELAVLGTLEELEILDGESIIPINFKHEDHRSAFARNGSKADTVHVCSNAEGNQLSFVGGDQELPVDALPDTSKYLVDVGEVYSITYWTDKHHLVGERGFGSYQHEFGEEGGIRPILVYSLKDKKLTLVGGSYTVEAEGIKN